jgi:hypothetical protein
MTDLSTPINPSAETTGSQPGRERALELLDTADRDVSENFASRTGEHKADVLAAAQVHATLAVAQALEGVSVNLDYICAELNRMRQG